MARLGYLQVTRRCNQRCVFCSNPPNDNVLDPAEARVRLLDLKEQGCVGVILSGGEPTLCEELPQIIRLAREIGLPPRVISNGQLLAEQAALAKLAEAGLEQLHLSIHSIRPEVQDTLAGNEGSLSRLLAAFENGFALGMTVAANVVLNSRNADHLDQIVRELCGRFPRLHHFVFNNIDPRMNRVAENPWTVARLAEIELSLHRALAFLTGAGRTFRVERVPLCYMADFAHCSTEARKIIKGEDRIVHFLDQKGRVYQNVWRYGKAEACGVCHFSMICPGLFEMDTFYSSRELFPVFLDPEDVRQRVHDGGEE